ncbi:MAG TPA: hypothetical protein VKR79_10775 [Gaiellaceae bacterium]|nr:hypothetical protein [Gaiellaceae bacterium]
MNVRLVVAAVAAFVLIAASFGIAVSSGPNGSGDTSPFVRSHPVIPVAASFVSPDRGWELGRSGCLACSALRVTADGGHSWTTLPPPPARLSYNTPSAAGVLDVAFADGANGWLFGPGLYSSHDGGRSWTLQQLSGVSSVEAAAGDVYALTKTALWRSPAGRDDWTRLPVPSLGGRNGAAFALSGSSVLLLDAGYQGPGLGLPGKLWFSPNRGTTWHSRTVPCRHQGGAAAVASAGGHGWLLECYSNEQSSQAQQTSHVVYLTGDDGKTWRSLGRPTRQGEPSRLGGAGNHAFLATESGGADELVGSVDGGRHWRVVLDLAGEGFTGWADLGFLSPSVGFVVGPTHYVGPSGRDHVYRTDDGGRRWRVIA